MLVILLICWPLIEIFVAVKVAEAIGVLFTVLLLLVSWPLGLWAIRSRGAAAWRRLGDAVAAGRPPGREVLDGALVLAGGALLLVPGFVTDVVGLCLLFAPSRGALRAVLVRNLQSRLVRAATGATRGPGNRRSTAATPARERYDVESTATEVGRPRLHR